MNLEDRIQQLRKAKGISQEELAHQIGVSRQAVSKWESAQSVPDIENVIIMSDIFNVSTDYILKGIEQTVSASKINATFFVVVATAINFVGLLAASAVWYEWQTAMAYVLGFGFMAVGCVVFAVGMMQSSSSEKAVLKYKFYEINIWLLSFIPLSFFYNVIFGGIHAPYPLFSMLYPLFWIVYFAVCMLVVFGLKSKLKTADC